VPRYKRDREGRVIVRELERNYVKRVFVATDSDGLFAATPPSGVHNQEAQGLGCC